MQTLAPGSFAHATDLVGFNVPTLLVQIVGVLSDGESVNVRTSDCRDGSRGAGVPLTLRASQLTPTTRDGGTHVAPENPHDEAQVARAAGLLRCTPAEIRFRGSFSRGLASRYIVWSLGDDPRSGFGETLELAVTDLAAEVRRVRGAK